MMPSVERKQLKISVTPAAKEIVERYAEKADMSEQGVASRIYEWFGRQHPTVQKAVLGFADEDTDMEKVQSRFSPLNLDDIDPIIYFHPRSRGSSAGAATAAKTR
jgi:hypothetical protein